MKNEVHFLNYISLFFLNPPIKTNVTLQRGYLYYQIQLMILYAYVDLLKMKDIKLTPGRRSLLTPDMKLCQATPIL